MPRIEKQPDTLAPLKHDEEKLVAVRATVNFGGLYPGEEVLADPNDHPLGPGGPSVSELIGAELLELIEPDKQLMGGGS